MQAAPDPGPARPAFPRWGWWVMMALPALFVLIGSVMLIDAAGFAMRAERATATVVSIARVTGDDGIAYRPSVSYADSLGQPREGVSHVASAHYNYAPGAEIEILYDPADPAEVRIGGLFALWRLPLMFIGLGGVFLAVVRFLRRRFSPARLATRPPIG